MYEHCVTMFKWQRGKQVGKQVTWEPNSGTNGQSQVGGKQAREDWVSIIFAFSMIHLVKLIIMTLRCEQTNWYKVQNIVKMLKILSFVWPMMFFWRFSLTGKLFAVHDLWLNLIFPTLWSIQYSLRYSSWLWIVQEIYEAALKAF